MARERRRCGVTDDKRVFDRGLALRLLEDGAARSEVLAYVAGQWSAEIGGRPTFDVVRERGGDDRFKALLQLLVDRNPADVYRGEPSEPGVRADWHDKVDLPPALLFDGKLIDRWDGKVVLYKTPKTCPIRCVGVHNAAKLAVSETLMPVLWGYAEEHRRAEVERKNAEAAKRRDAEAAAAKRKAEKEAAARAAKARRLGTQGVTFAGASCRFKEHGRDVFMIRADLRSAFVDADGLCLADAAGATWRPEVKDAAVALAEVLDWRWRGAAEWAESQHGADYRERGTLGEFEPSNPAQPGTFDID